MRRSFIFVLCICLLLASAIPAFAAEEVVFTVTASANTASRGDIIDVLVRVDANKEYRALGFKPDFDNSVFDFVPQSGEMEAIPNVLFHEFKEDNLAFGFNFQGSKSYAHSGKLLHFQLKVKTDAAFAQATISLKEVTLTGASYRVDKATVTIACKHNYNSYVKVDNENHKAECTICHGEVSVKHTWDNGVVSEGTNCETPGKKTYTCTAKGCGATKVEDVKVTGHTWDNACDTECNSCGSKREVNHKYSDKYSQDKEKHWYACTICGHKKDEYKHTPDRDAPTEQNAQLCKYCGYVIAEKIAHVHDISPQIQKDAEGHWYYCSKAGCYDRIDLQDHIYDNACDIDCNVCEYIRIPPHQYKPEWRGSAEGHWRVCALCNAESEIVPHVPGAPATETDPQVCEDCQFWIQWPQGHTHTFGEAWEHNEEGHWHVCQECQGCSETQAHNWDEGSTILEATESHEGKVKYVCTDCQAENVESIPALDSPEPSAPVESTQPTVPTQPGDSGKEGGFPWWILAVAAGVLLVAGIVLLVVELIRSKKTNMHGRFSK